MDDSPITPASVIIARFGGAPSLSKRLNIPLSTVRNWPSGGIPGKWHSRLLLEAEKDGIELSPSELVDSAGLSRAS